MAASDLRWALNPRSQDSLVKSPITLRRVLFRAFVISTFLLVASVQGHSLLHAMGLERAGPSQTGIPHPSGMVFYVSGTGDDAWSGMLAETNPAKTDGPFATPGRARDAIRSIQMHGPLHQPVSVYLRGGVYTLSSPLVFLPEDSGTAESPITYSAYPGENVVLSGGRTITGLTKAAEAGQPNSIWNVEVPGVKEGEWYFHQLFVDGQRRQRSRLPHTGFYHADGQFLAGNPSRFTFHPGDIHAAWAEQGDVEVVGLEKWAEFRLLLRTVRPPHPHRHALLSARPSAMTKMRVTGWRTPQTPSTRLESGSSTAAAAGFPTSPCRAKM